MNQNIKFSRSLLSHARQEAKAANVNVPKNLTAMRIDAKWFLVEGDGGFSMEVTADNAFNAKEKIIGVLIMAR